LMRIFAAVFGANLQVRPSLMSSISIKIGQIEAHLGTSVSIEIARMCAVLVSCGFDCPALRTILTRPLEDPTAAFMLFAMTELGMQIDKDWIDQYTRAPGSALLAWSACANGYSDLLDAIEPGADSMQGIRNDLLIAQLRLEAKMVQNESWQSWAKQFEQQFPDRLYIPALPKQQRRLREDGAEKRLSQTLMTLRVPHRPDVLCCDASYKVAVVLPQKNIAVDIWSHDTDNLNERLSRSAEIRREHLQKYHGYEVLNCTAETVHQEAAHPEQLWNKLLEPIGGLDAVRSL